jgi:hypothetical protein
LHTKMDASAILAMTQLGQPSIGELANSYADLVAEFRPLNAVQTAATFAGLLSKPELQANCLRLEALVHFATLHCGGSKNPTKGFIRRSFDGLTEGYCGMAEDPAEDLFTALVNTPKGNFRVFEGIREGNAFHLQRILNIIEAMPDGEPFARFRSCVEDLLKISDAVAERASVQENVLGCELPLKSLPAEHASDLSRLRHLVRFTEEDLDRLRVNRQSLAEFAFDPGRKDALAAQAFGHTDLERRPFAFVGESTYLLLPTAIGSAITRFIIEFASTTGRTDVFERSLAADFADIFRTTPLLGTRMPLPFQRIRGGHIGAVMREVDPGRFLDLVFFVDGLHDFFEHGFCGTNAAPDALASAVKLHIRQAAEKAQVESNFTFGLTILVGCGYGRGLAMDLDSDMPDNWRFEYISAYDLATLSWLSDFDCLSLWRIFDARDALAQSGTEIFNVNGLLNLVAWALENEGHLVPHGQLPDDFVQPEGHRLITINQNSLRNLRHRVITEWDSRRILDGVGDWVSVKRFERTYFEEDNTAPLYVSMEVTRTHRLRAAYNAPKRSWWIEVIGPEPSESFPIYERWMMLCTWLRRAAPILDSAYRLPEGPLSVRVYFAEAVAVTRGRTAPKTGDELRSLVHVIAQPDVSDIRIDIESGFDDGLIQPDNIAERVLVEALVKGVAIAGGGGDNAEKHEAISAAICPNAEMRHMHRFEAQNFRDFLRSEIGRKPLLVNQFDHAACLLGLGWRDRPRALGAEITGVSECTSYLNKTVEILMQEICDTLGELDRRALVNRFLMIHEAACVDRDVWRRTARANLAMHENRSEAIAAIVEHDGRLGVCLTLSRILIEAAICECPPHGGRAPGELDLSRLMSRAQLVFSFGGDSDAVYWGAMEPWIRVTPLGDIHMKRLFEQDIYGPFVRAGGAVQVEHAAERYTKLYDPLPSPQPALSVLGSPFLRAWESESGCSVDGMRAFIEELGRIGLERNEPILCMKKSALVDLLAQAAGISVDQASESLARWTLQTRPKWVIKPDGFKNRDWQPWRFRRRLSVLRRPFLEIEAGGDPEIVFSPGVVSDAFMATMMWFHEGDIHQAETRSADMESWIGHVNNENGNKFTREVEAKLSGLGWKTEREIHLTKLLARGSDERFGDLKRYGDIDVLAWRPDPPRVLAVECKDLQFRKTPGEVAEQLADFRGELKANGKPDLLRRHLDRIEVLNGNPDDVAKALNLSLPVAIEGHLVFSNPVPMQYAWEHMAARVRLSIFKDLDRI